MAADRGILTVLTGGETAGDGAKFAEVGEFHGFRLGVNVRIQDGPGVATLLRLPRS
jgi:hypothetical protein